MRISHDPDKREWTLRERGLDFEDAAAVFTDPRSTTLLDDRRDYGEEHYQTFGYMGDRLVMVVWTMSENKRALGSNLAKVDATTDEEIAEDPDTAPEWTEADFDRAEVWDGNKFLGHGRDFKNGRRVGRPKGSGTKEMVTLRLDKDVLERFRAGGPGWQTRVNDVLRMAVMGRVAQRWRAAAK